MAINSQRTRIVPWAGAPAGGHGSWGSQPSGPLLNFGQKPGRGRRGSAGSKGRPGGILPSAGALDYAHKLTTTTLLLAGVVGFLLFGRNKKPRSVLRRLASKHVVPAGGS